MRNLRFLAAFVGVLFAFGGNGFSEALPDGGITLQEMAQILTAKGYKAEIKVAKDDSEETRILSAAEGYHFAIYFYAMSDEGRAKNIQYCLSFDARSDITNDKALDWNRHYRYGRMYLNDKGEPFLEMDRDLEHGCTTEAVDNDLERWFSLISTFAKFLFEKNGT